MLSEKDLKDAAEYRAVVHKEALAKVRAVCPDADFVIDRYPVDSYFEDVWDYPGQWYTYVSVPKECGSRDALIDTIVKDTLAYYCKNKTAQNLRKGAAQKECGDRSKKTETERTQPRAKAGFELDRCPQDDPFYACIAAYPDCAVDYCIVTGDPLGYRGCESHWQALCAACEKLLAPEGWQIDTGKARGNPVDAEALFTSAYPKDKLNYRKAFLYPPHGIDYSGVDFVKINAMLFPNGTNDLEAYEWTTDWSDYFDEGHEWWGALCNTVYDKTLDRFAVILASATD